MLENHRSTGLILFMICIEFSLNDVISKIIKLILILTKISDEISKSFFLFRNNEVSVKAHQRMRQIFSKYFENYY